jgi:hypothetical protein
VTDLLGVTQRAAADVAHVRDGRRVHLRVFSFRATYPAPLTY